MSATPASQQQFCVRWNSHLGSLGAAFPQLLAGQRFVDVTLACEGHQLHCHRLVLAACSSYFESLLSENPCKHPIIIMPHDIKLWEIQALVDFMYKGEVNVSQAGLPDLLRCAEVLQIRGLCGSDAALNLNSVTNAIQSKEPNTLCGNTSNSSTSPHPVIPTTSSAVSSSPSSSPAITASAGSTHPSAPTGVAASAVASNSVTASNNISSAGQQKLPLTTAGLINPVRTCSSPGSQTTGQSSTSANCSANVNKRVITMLQDTGSSSNSNGGGGTSTCGINKSTSQQQPNNIVTPKLEPVDISMEEDMDEDSSNTMNDISKTETEEPDYMEGSGKQGNEKQLSHHPTQTQQHLIENSDEACENKRTSCRNGKKIGTSRSPILDHDYGEEYNGDSSNSSGLNEGQEQQQQQQQLSTNLSRKYEEDAAPSGVSLKRRQMTTIPDGLNIKRVARMGMSSPLLAKISSCSSLSSSPSSSPAGSPNLSNNNNNSNAANQNLGKIRVKSDENLYENYGKIFESNNVLEQSEEDMVQQLPASLKFNKDEMTIFVKKPDANGENQHTAQQSCPMIRAVRSLASPSSIGGAARTGFLNSARHGQNSSAYGAASAHSSPVASPDVSDVISICYDTPEIGETTTIKTEIDITDEQEQTPDYEQEQDSTSNYENIVCSPTVHDYSNFNEDDEEDESVGIHIQGNVDYNNEEPPTYDDIKLDEAYGADASPTQPIVINSHLPGTSANIPRIIIPTLATYTTHSPSPVATDARPISNGGAHITTRVTNRSNVLKNAYLAIYNKSTGRYREVVGPITVGNSITPAICYQTSSAQERKIDVNGTTLSPIEPHTLGPGGQNTEKKFDPSLNPSPSAVVLRNPRSNQPRSYSTEALYAALMDVKAGESIYRASQLHKVPRKTLRNWMKRWHIKSAFPMPRQLKQAAEKKRLKQMEIKMEKFKDRDSF